MPGEILYWLINMSIVASLMGLIVMALRKIRFIPHRVSVFLWIVPFLRMTIPLGVNSPYSLMSIISRYTTRTVTMYRPADDIELSASNVLMAAESYSPLTFAVEGLGKVFDIAFMIWAVVSIAILITIGVLYVTTKKEIKDAVLLEGNIFLSEKVTSPAVYGIFKPRIVLPAPLAGTDLKYIVGHEKTHIRRLDNLWRLLAFITAAVHWFNPLSWIFLKTFLADLELACDETAISGYGPEERKDYARTLLSASQSRNVFVSAFGGAGVRTRIENILSYRKITLISAVGFSVFILTVIYVLVTNAG